MTDTIAPQPSNRDKSASSEKRSLNYQDTFVCPVCRHGQLSAITLMDAFSCNFCRHIFTANLQNQTVAVEDSSQKMTWRWNGQTWQVGNQEAIELTWAIRLGSLALVLLPPIIIWLPSYIFPPLEGSNLDWLPNTWVWLTFINHLVMVSWLLAEYYQFPPYVATKVWVGNLFDRR
jgi:rubredoxin